MLFFIIQIEDADDDPIHLPAIQDGRTVRDTICNNHFRIWDWGWGERLVAGPIPMGPGRAQPEEITWDPLPAGSPPAGGAKGVGCIVSWAAAEGEDLGGPILGCRS